MTKRKVEVVSDRLMDGRNAFQAGDTLHVETDKAALWIKHGWARDPETGEQNERVPGMAVIRPDKVTAKVS